MMKRLRFALMLAGVLIVNNLRADEGMWLLSMLEGYTIEDMQAEGFKLTAEDIYSVNKACLKDAVVIFGGGCTGELISGEGLLLTNHHCGYGVIQSHSSVENDYLTDGFWAMNKSEELPNPRLSVQFMRYMKDVTGEVFKGITGETSEDMADRIIGNNMNRIATEALDGTGYEGYVRSMFHGNQYFLFVYERYNDVRLVGAPPSSIGNFGEDHDNWMWPRHTGDFSLFRIYANEFNEPAEYSVDNVPYKPKKFFEIDMAGVGEGDFTMVLGYPGSTDRFLYSKAVELLMEKSYPMRIDMRTQRLEIMDKYMKQSDKVRIQYASKYRRVSNAWKKWQGAIKGLERLDAVHVKRSRELSFMDWLKEDARRQEKYGTLMESFEKAYAEKENLDVVDILMSESVMAVEIFQEMSRIYRMMNAGSDAEALAKQADGFYKNYNAAIDRDIFAAMMKAFMDYAPESYYPAFIAKTKKKGGDFSSLAEKRFKTSSFNSREKLQKLIDLYAKKPENAIKKIEKEGLWKYLEEIREIYRVGMSEMPRIEAQLDQLYNIWVRANFEFEPEKRQYPDANFTMRLTYGEVEGYKPQDGVEYLHYTNLSGVIDKSLEGKHDYVIPDRLKELYDKKDYGDYGVSGTMPVCFTASNHTSGGNSGSPVLNDEGRLIGINFDRNWHGTMSDEMYDPDMCRNISVDIRYVLFIIDKYANAGYLLDEMVLVK